MEPEHGTANRYRNLGCRCPECRAAASKRQAEYYARHRDEWNAYQLARYHARKGRPT